VLAASNPALLQPCFARMERLLAEQPLRRAFGRLDDRSPIAWDRTEYFRSQNLGCTHCVTRKRFNG
jgi:hypothetical protein